MVIQGYDTGGTETHNGLLQISQRATFMLTLVMMQVGMQMLFVCGWPIIREGHAFIQRHHSIQLHCT